MPVLQLLTCCALYSHSTSSLLQWEEQVKAILPTQGQSTASPAGELS